MKNDNYILQLKTGPGSDLGLSQEGLSRFKKELIRVGSYVKDTTDQHFTVVKDTLSHWKKTFDLWLANGNKVSIPLAHETAGEAEDNQGWVTALTVEGDSLFGVMELKDPELALTSDVSIYVPTEAVDGKGITYKAPITHVALCTDPVIPGLKQFEKLELSYGDSNMEFMKKIYGLLKLSGDKATEEGALTAVTKLMPKVDPEPARDLDPLANLLCDNRALKLAGLLKVGLVTPELGDIIKAKYIEPKACALELSQKTNSDAFDFLFEVLSKNKPVEPGEKTGPQTLELANTQTGKENPIKADVEKRRVAAGMKA